MENEVQSESIAVYIHIILGCVHFVLWIIIIIFDECFMYDTGPKMKYPVLLCMHEEM